jgi:hypothetical protein
MHLNSTQTSLTFNPSSALLLNSAALLPTHKPTFLTRLLDAKRHMEGFGVPLSLVSAWFPGSPLPLDVSLQLEVDGHAWGPRLLSNINASRRAREGFGAFKALAGCAATTFRLMGRPGPGALAALDVVMTSLQDPGHFARVRAARAAASRAFLTNSERAAAVMGAGGGIEGGQEGRSRSCGWWRAAWLGACDSSSSSTSSSGSRSGSSSSGSSSSGSGSSSGSSSSSGSGSSSSGSSSRGAS